MLKRFKSWRNRKKFSQRKALLRATRTLYSSQQPYQPYERVNRLLNNWQFEVPLWVKGITPEYLHNFLFKRIRQKVVHVGLATLVKEGIALHDPLKAYEAALPLPKSALPCWEDNTVKVSRSKSFWRFVISLLSHTINAKQTFQQLNKIQAGKQTENSPPDVVLYDFPENLWLDAKENSSGGFLHWFAQSSPLAKKTHNIWLHLPETGTGETLQSDSQKLTVLNSRSCFPALKTKRKKFAFVSFSIFCSLLALFGCLVGRWQMLVLLSDLIEWKYFTELDRDQKADAYCFSLGSQMNRPLWSCEAEQNGIPVPLIFHASSYDMFHYNSKAVPDSQKHPSVVGNLWPECWVQTEKVKTSFENLFSHKPDIKVVGAYDFVDNSQTIPELPESAILVFDNEPNRRLLEISERGYICPFLKEDTILQFWQVLIELAEEMSLTLVHKPKRVNAHLNEHGYAHLLRTLKGADYYMELPPGIGVQRAMAEVKASVILPFTSIGDIAYANDFKAVFYDVHNGIENPERLALGLKTLNSKATLKKWLLKQLEPA